MDNRLVIHIIRLEQRLLQQENSVYKLAAETADFIGAGGCVRRVDVVANCDYVGEGYGIPTRAMNDAVMLLARLEGLLFDPVYSGKGLAGTENQHGGSPNAGHKVPRMATLQLQLRS